MQRCSRLRSRRSRPRGRRLPTTSSSPARDADFVKEHLDDLVNPLDPVEGGFWDAIKYDPPRGLTVDSTALALVWDVARRTRQANELIRAREAFKSSQMKPGSKHAADRLSAYDLLIDFFLGQLIAKLDELRPAIEAAQRWRPIV